MSLYQVDKWKQSSRLTHEVKVALAWELWVLVLFGNLLGNYILQVMATQMTLRNCSTEENGGARTHVILVEGEIPRKHLRRTLLLVWRTDISVNDFSALLRKWRCKNRGSKSFSLSIYFCGADLPDFWDTECLILIFTLKAIRRCVLRIMTTVANDFIIAWQYPGTGDIPCTQVLRVEYFQSSLEFMHCH